MPINHEDILVSLEYGAWPTAESFSSNGYKAAKADMGLKVTVHNNSDQHLIWCNVDIGLHHNNEGSRMVMGEYEEYKIVLQTIGMEPFVLHLGQVQAGKTAERIHVHASQYRKISTSTNYSALRCYGGTLRGEQFIKHMAHGFFPPVSVTNKNPYADGKCFIAHAAFQDTTHPVVCELRLARDELLKTNRAGRQFIAFYYRHSPRIASIIAKRPALRAAARVMLRPISKASRYIRVIRNARYNSNQGPC